MEHKLAVKTNTVYCSVNWRTLEFGSWCL